MPAALDLVGQRFGRLVVEAKSPVRDQNKKVVWHCVCDCGAKVAVNTKNLRTSNTRSCGCLHRDTATKHGMRNTRVYRIWASMRVRCRPDFPMYGARGVRVCRRWEKFENFLADMGEPEHGMTIDRKNNDKGYSPSNCRWADKTTQSVNRSCTRFLTFQGKTMCVSHWARELGMQQSTLSFRVRHGWSVERALTTPVKEHK